RLADVLDGPGGGAPRGGELLEVLAVGPGVGVDQVGDLYALHLGERIDMAAAPAVEPGDAEPDRVVGPDHPARRLGPTDGEPDTGRGGQRLTEELTTTLMRHDPWLLKGVGAGRRSPTRRPIMGDAEDDSQRPVFISSGPPPSGPGDGRRSGRRPRHT